MEEILGLRDNGLKNNVELAQEITNYMWLKNGEDYKGMYAKVTGMRVFNELYNRMNQTDDVDKLRADCMLKIVEFIKSNPRASEVQLEKEVFKHVKEFKEKITTL